MAASEIVGVIGTLSGLLVGAIATYKVQERQLRYADKTRFHEHRLAAYAKFANAGNVAASWWRSLAKSNIAPDKVSDYTKQQVTASVSEFLLAKETVRLIATERVIERTNALHRIFGQMQEEWNVDSRVPKNMAKEFDSAQAAFIRAARDELGVNE